MIIPPNPAKIPFTTKSFKTPGFMLFATQLEKEEKPLSIHSIGN